MQAGVDVSPINESLPGDSLLANAATVHRAPGRVRSRPVRGQVNGVRAWIEARLAPRPIVEQRWTVNDAPSMAVIPHGAWTRFLGRYRRVDAAGVARVAYGEVQPDDRATLSDYLGDLQSTPVSQLARAEQLPFWVNLYNAATVSLVLRHYPVASIRDIGPRLSLGPWQIPIVAVEGQELSLAQIENRILRPIWKDPRLHYVLNCASIGCPNLPLEAMTRANAESLLEVGRRAYVSGSRGTCVSTGGILASSIYNWFRNDFGGMDGVIAHLLEGASPAVAEVLNRRSRIDRYFYDWDLNDAA